LLIIHYVGRKFFSFQDVLKNKEQSDKLDWHYIDFLHDNPRYHDGFDYKNWEGHYSLVKLNLDNPEVREYIFDVARYWLKDVGIDGWRLDVGYLLDIDFLKSFRCVCKSIKNDCFLLGEMIHGPYNKWVGPELLDAGTGYQVYKSLWNAINDKNMYELKAILDQSFHPNYGHNKNTLLVNFLGNHDTTRISSLFKDDHYVIPAYLLLFTLNGVPKIYYGDEMGVKGIKTAYSDKEVRKPMINASELKNVDDNPIWSSIKRFIQIRQENPALKEGELLPVFADNVECNVIGYLRQSQASDQTLLVVVSTSEDTVVKKIPLWNLDLDGAEFEDILNDDSKRYKVKNNQLKVKIHSFWGRILELQ